MDPLIVTAMITSAASLGVAGVTGWFAYKAAKYAKPTGNGFAAKVLDAFARVEHKLGTVEAQVQGLLKADDEQDERILRIEMIKGDK